MTAITLPSGHPMPVIGLGTWQASGDVIESAIGSALATGYRHIDTAFNYDNEQFIGEAIKKWLANGGKREDLFVTTKLPVFGNRAEEVADYVSKSLNNLQLEYIDLYLIHMPFGFKARPSGTDPPVLDLSTDHIALWKALEEQVKLGKIRSLGLSNFNARQIERLASAVSVPISNLQVELHALHQQPELRETCHKLGIAVTAYAPLGSPTATTHIKNKYGIELDTSVNPLKNEKVLAIAERVLATPAQVLLKFLIELGVIVIPKSSNPDRILENFKAQDVVLTKDDVDELKSLDLGEKGRIFDFLFWRGVEKHPEYPFTIPGSV